MLHHADHIIRSLDTDLVTGVGPGVEHLAVAIRRARDEDAPLLHDLAELDSAVALEGPVLVALVEGTIWAAVSLDDDRVIADPFLPTRIAVELLRLRVRQLRAADGRPQRRMLPRWVRRRARARAEGAIEARAGASHVAW